MQKKTYYLSPAPQAEPQAAGFSSGLSPAPQAEPQAAAGLVSIFLLQPNRFESAIFVTSVFVFSERSALCTYHSKHFRPPHKYALFYYPVTFW